MSLIENALEKMRRGGSKLGPQVNPESLHEPLSASERATAARPTDSPGPECKRVAIDWQGVRETGYLPDESESRRFAEHYRHIKRPLIEKALASDSAPNARLILLSSALPGDGKTFTAVNLALSIARERDVSVVLVDADIPRSRVTEILGLRKEPGLVDALVNEEQDVESCVVRTDVPGLDVLPAGQTAENATELLASARMVRIAERLLARDPRRLVIFDSAPLLGSNEARALLRIPGQMVLVVRARVTPRSAVLEAVAHLDTHKLTGFILNEVITARGSGRYYGYSNYGAPGNEAISD